MCNSKMTNKINEFMTRVNKLTLGRSTSDGQFGRVTLKKSADHSKGRNAFLGRTGYGTRKFAVSGSQMISNGSYTLSGLRAKLQSI